jgi:hypothetical protein
MKKLMMIFAVATMAACNSTVEVAPVVEETTTDVVIEDTTTTEVETVEAAEESTSAK